MLKKTSIHSVSRPFFEGGIEPARNTREKEKLNQSLSQLLTSTYGLYQECLYYYWTVAGDNHIGLDELFEKQYEALQASGEQIAERLRTINFYTVNDADHLYLPSFPENRTAVTSVQNMLTNVIKGHETCSKQALSALETAEALDDQKTATILLQAMLMHDKAIWMMRSLRS